MKSQEVPKTIFLVHKKEKDFLPLHVQNKNNYVPNIQHCVRLTHLYKTLIASNILLFFK